MRFLLGLKRLGVGRDVFEYKLHVAGSHFITCNIGDSDNFKGVSSIDDRRDLTSFELE